MLNIHHHYLVVVITAIEKALLGVCSQLGDNQFGKICNTVVLVYGHELLNALITYETPVRVCTDQLPLCPKNSTVEAPVATPVVEAPKAEAKAGDAECEICKYAVGQIENFINSNHSQQEIQKKLNQLCSNIPSVFTQTCLSIARMVPYIIKKLEDHNSPSQICSGLHLCSSKQAFIAKQFAAPVMTSEVKKLAICPACIMAMELVQREINQQSIDKFVEDKLDKVCAKLPSTFGPACENLVDTYTPVLVQKLLLAVTPTKICKFVHACPSAEPKNVIKSLKANIVKLN